jgi:hypothetical protein
MAVLFWHFNESHSLWLILVAKWVTPGFVTTTESMRQAMLQIAKKGFPKKVLENADINAASLPY